MAGDSTRVTGPDDRRDRSAQSPREGLCADIVHCLCSTVPQFHSSTVPLAQRIPLLCQSVSCCSAQAESGTGAGRRRPEEVGGGQWWAEVRWLWTMRRTSSRQLWAELRAIAPPQASGLRFRRPATAARRRLLRSRSLHDSLLRRLREPSSPPNSRHPVLPAVARADAALDALSDRFLRRPRLGESIGAGLHHRCHGLLQVRRLNEGHRGRHGSQRHRQAARHPRIAALSS